MASEVKGWQVGAINLSGHIRGRSAYRVDQLLAHWAVQPQHLARRSRLYPCSPSPRVARSFYTAFTTGFTDEAGQRRWAVGRGWWGAEALAAIFSRPSTFTATESAATSTTITKRTLNFGCPKWELAYAGLAQDNYLTRIKLETGVSLLSHLSLFGGVSLNQLSTDGHQRLIESGSRYEKEWEDGIFTWPGFFFGLRYGR